jgi:uncharacterized membrane protein YqjE
MIMDTEVDAPSRSRLHSLFNRFGDQMLRLGDTHLALFRAELRGAVKIYSKHLILTISLGLVAGIGFSFVSVGLVLWVNAHINNLAISFCCVGGAYVTFGVLSALAAVRRMTNQPSVFSQTLVELEGDQQWIKTETQPAS